MSIHQCCLSISPGTLNEYSYNNSSVPRISSFVSEKTGKPKKDSYIVSQRKYEIPKTKDEGKSEKKWQLVMITVVPNFYKAGTRDITQVRTVDTTRLSCLQGTSVKQKWK